jgi:hypothetical protein
MRSSASSTDGSDRNTISIRYPLAFHLFIIRTYVRPLNVLSNAKSFRAFTNRLSSVSTSRPPRLAASSGRSGESPDAIRSAFTKWITPASRGRNSRANVVFPAPFGPAMTTHRGVDLEPALGDPRAPSVHRTVATLPRSALPPHEKPSARRPDPASPDPCVAEDTAHT